MKLKRKPKAHPAPTQLAAEKMDATRWRNQLYRRVQLALHLTRRKRLLFYISRSPSTRVESTALADNVRHAF